MTERDPISTPALPGGLPFDASQIQFTPAGAGAVARSVQSIERAVARGGDYDTAANFLASVNSLTEAFGVASLNVGVQTGWALTGQKAAFPDTAINFLGVKNPTSKQSYQTNYFVVLGQDDNNTTNNVVPLYSAFYDNHPTGTRASSVGFEGDILHTGAGTTTGEVGVIGFARVDAGVVGTQSGVQGQVTVTAGTVTNSAGVTGFAIQSGGAITNSYAGWFQGPNKTGGTVTNNYGVYIGRVGSGGSSTNYQLYVEGSGAGNPVVIDNAGNLGIGNPTPGNLVDIRGAAGYNFKIGDLSTGDRIRIKNQAAGAGASFESVNSAENAFAPLFLGASTLTISGTFGCNGATAQAASTGYGTPTNGSKQASFDATAITLPNLAKAVAQLIIDLKAFGFLAA